MYDFGETFHRKFDALNTFGNANIIAEVGSEAEGTWLSACNKKLPARKLPLRDTSQPQRMIIAARCPTGALPELQVLFRDFLGTVDAVRGADIADEEKGKDVIFGTITEWLSRSDGNPSLPNDILLLRLPPTYELKNLLLLLLARKNIKSTAAAPATPDVSMDRTDSPSFPDVDDRKVGDMYPPDLLSDHRGECYAHTKAMMPQRNIRDQDDKLIAPHEIYSQLTEGTLFNAIINFETFAEKAERIEKDAMRVGLVNYYRLNNHNVTLASLDSFAETYNYAFLDAPYDPLRLLPVMPLQPHTPPHQLVKDVKRPAVWPLKLEVRLTAGKLVLVVFGTCGRGRVCLTSRLNNLVRPDLADGLAKTACPA
ncbi:hypothetical protein B0H14DRAFT_3517988 [Mycena olivaceomarginata]|nr:hypothetical protein B0H14DRAFT_3517988 [Mycena olivaceomarginata]